MAKRKAWLVKRVRLNGKWTTGKPVRSKWGRLTHRVRVNGETRELDGIFRLEYHDEKGKRCREVIGPDMVRADKALAHMQRKLDDLADGHPVQLKAPGKHDLFLCIDEYVAHLKRRKRTPKTIAGIEKTFELLPARSLEDLNVKAVAETFVSRLEAKGYAPQTVYDKFAKVVSFLKWAEAEYGVKRLVTLKDGPAKPRISGSSDAGKKDPYTKEELDALNRLSTEDERLIWMFLLQTGCREQEWAHAEWSDLDLKNRLFHIRAKNGFTPKDKTDRTDPFGQKLADALKPRKAVGLVFGNNGLPQRHLLRVLKKRAEEAGLDPKKCVLHRFRHTFACMHLRAGVDIKTVSDWLGHSDLATTAIYLKKIQSESDATKAMVDRTFA